MAELIVDHLEIIHIRITDNGYLIDVERISEHLLGISNKTSSVVKARKLVFLRDLFKLGILFYESLE